VSGQIGLVPSSMTLPCPEHSVALQIALSIQHAERVAAATMDTLGLGSSTLLQIYSAILWTVNEADISKVSAAWSWLQAVRVSVWIALQTIND
jgi:enamine deaminase RidA (YjgF/YER057c/UK114 family)